MIAAWMLAATLFGLLAGATAFAAERALRLLRRQGRSAWMVALVVTCAWPVLAPALRRPADQSVQVAGATASAGTVLAVPDEPAAPSPLLRERLALLDTPLLVAWGVVSALLLAYAAVAALALRRLAARAERRIVDGRAVLITPAVGPAAFGIVRPRIVLPSWSLELDRSMRELVLRHEVEHVESADPAVLVLAWLLTALMPWNLPLWWILRRLRTATELDCDCRVLRGTADTRRYSQLLVLIAQRQGQATFASMIAGAPSTLSQRIAAMHAVPPTRPLLRAAALTLGALIVGAAAASPVLARELANVRERVVPTPPSAVVPSAPSGTVVAQDTARKTVPKTLTIRTASRTPRKLSAADSQAQFASGSEAPRYPQILKLAGVTGKTVVQFVVDTTGEPIVSTLKVVRSAHQLFTVSVQNALPNQRFVAASVGGRKVKQLVQVVYRFDIAGMPFTDTLPVPSGAVRTLEVFITGSAPRDQSPPPEF